MTDLSGVSFVIPVYNEAANIPPLFDGLIACGCAAAEILLCYDFDEDTTLPAARVYAGRLPRLAFVKNAYGRGVVGALKTGFERAAGPAVIVMMADLSDDLRCIGPMVELFRRGYAVVAPSRYMKGGSQEMRGPVLKKVLSRAAGVSLYYLAGLPIHDATNNFRLYAKDFLRTVTVESGGGFEIALELTAKAYRAGCRIAEVPAAYTDRQAGASRFRIMRWLPGYLRWYWYAICSRLSGRGRASGASRRSS